MKLVAFGLNHTTAPLEIREKLWLNHDEVVQVLKCLKGLVFTECFAISTCNRTEIYGIYDRKPDSVFVIQSFLRAKKVDDQGVSSHFYWYDGFQAAQHLFRVASGVDSMVVGDVQVVGQLKEGYKLAQERGATGAQMERLMQAALHTAKRSRAETHISEGAVSVSYAGVEKVCSHFTDLSQLSAIVIGAGKTSELTAKHLKSKGIGKLEIANRTYSKAQKVAGKFGADAIALEDVESKLGEVDIMITSVGTGEALVTRDMVGRVMKQRNGKALCIVDLGVPRNVEAAVREIEGVELFDIDALSEIVEHNKQCRDSDVPKIEEIIGEELNKLEQWHENLEVHPTIRQLHSHFEEVRQGELEKYIHRLSEKDRDLVDMITKRIVNKLLHTPTVELKNGRQSGHEERHRTLHVVHNLFGLNQVSAHALIEEPDHN